MPADDPRIVEEAAKLRAALSKVAPNYASLSDGDVIRQALQDPQVGPQTKARLRGTFGDTVLTSFAKGLGRGIGLDLPAAALDAALGTNTQSYLNDDLAADNPMAGLAGNVVGSIGGFVGGTGLVGAGIKGVKALNTLRGAKPLATALTGAYQNVAQGYGQQAQEMAAGDRTQIDPSNLALQGAVGAAGGATIPWMLGKQGAIRAAAPGVRGTLKAAGLGGAVSGLEGAAQGASAALENKDVLAPSRREVAPDVWNSALAGGVTGLFLGGALDGLDGKLSRTAGGTRPAATPAPSVAARTAPPVARAGASPSPTLQTSPPIPKADYSNQEFQRAFSQLRQFAGAGQFDRLKAAGSSDITNRTVLAQVAEANRALDNPRVGGFIDPDSKMVIPAVRLKGNDFDTKGIWIVQDTREGSPTFGQRLWVPDNVMRKYMGVEQDRLGFEQVVRPLADRPMFNGSKEPVFVGGRPAIPVGVSQTGPDSFEVSVVYTDQSGPTAVAETIQVDPTNDYQYGATGGSFFEALLTGQKVDKSNREARRARRRMSPNQPWYEGQPVSPEEAILRQEEEALDQLSTTNTRTRQSIRGVRQ